MSMSQAAERRSLSDDEWSVVEKSRRPAVDGLDADGLAEARDRLRRLRGKSAAK